VVPGGTDPKLNWSTETRIWGPFGFAGAPSCAAKPGATSAARRRPARGRPDKTERARGATFDTGLGCMAVLGSDRGGGPGETATGPREPGHSITRRGPL